MAHDSNWLAKKLGKVMSYSERSYFSKKWQSISPNRDRFLWRSGHCTQWDIKDPKEVQRDPKNQMPSRLPAELPNVEAFTFGIHRGQPKADAAAEPQSHRDQISSL